MGMIVGRGQSKLQCDALGCSTESEYVNGEYDGQRDVLPVMSRRGWQCCTNGRTYCPEHAYGGEFKKGGQASRSSAERGRTWYGREIRYICYGCRKKANDLSAGFRAVNEVGRKSCDSCGGNKDDLNVVGVEEFERLTATKSVETGQSFCDLRIPKDG